MQQDERSAGAQLQMVYAAERCGYKAVFGRFHATSTSAVRGLNAGITSRAKDRRPVVEPDMSASKIRSAPPSARRRSGGISCLGLPIRGASLSTYLRRPSAPS